MIHVDYLYLESLPVLLVLICLGASRHIATTQIVVHHSIKYEQYEQQYNEESRIISSDNSSEYTITGEAKQ